MRIRYLLLLYWMAIQIVYGQSLPKRQKNIPIPSSHEMQEIIVSGTRSKRKIEELPIPAQTISGRQIHTSGSVRLKDILQEQTGLNVMQDPHGNDLQLQGLQSRHILFMIDGEPLIGRNTGILDLQRISLANIERIEITKGPGSALYGSDALAGTINLITAEPKPGTHGNIYSRYSRNLTWDVGADLSYKKNDTAVSLFLNRYQTNGYDLMPETGKKNVYPNRNHSLGAKIHHQFSSDSRLAFSIRRYLGQSDLEMLGVQGNHSIREYSFNGRYTHRITKKWDASLGVYQTTYKTRFTPQDQQAHDTHKDSIAHKYYKPELVTTYQPNEKNILTTGTGLIYETIQGTRYPERKGNPSHYLFAQYEWKIFSKFNIIAGTRWDSNPNYGSQVSPKLAMKYDLNPNLSLKASIGQGFRAPDFSMLYLNFSHWGNGPFIYGVKELPTALERLQQAGKIYHEDIDRNKINPDLKPERSLGINIGATYRVKGSFNLSINLFRNDLKNMIELIPIVAEKDIYSYGNLSRTFTQGIELQISKHLLKCIHLSAGYQYLDTGDKSVIEKIKKGEITKTDPKTYITEKVRLKDYGGLFKRSKHSANIKLSYENPSEGLYATLRMIYTGKYGLDDKDGNGILAGSHEYVKDYTLWHISLGKKFLNGFDIQLGCDNLFDYTDKKQITDLFGRNFWGKITYQF